MDNSNPVRILPTEEYFALIRQMLEDTGQATVRVTGMSMRPLLYHMRDSVILVRPDDFHTGDIVLFDRLNGRYALHRVIHKGKDSFSMAGDNQWFFERDLPNKQIIGVVASINRKGRTIPCKRLSMKIYAFAVVMLTRPRIYLRRLVRRMLRLLHIRGPHAGKE